MLRMILRDLYAWKEPITPGNWRRLDAMVRERADDRAWHHAIFDRLNIRRTCAEHARRGSGRRRRAAAILAGMGVLHPLPMGRVRHGPVRAGALLGPAAGAARRRSAASGRPSDRVIGMPGRRARGHRALRRRDPLRSDHQHRHLVFHDDRLPPGQRRGNGGRHPPPRPGRPAERDIYASYINEAFLTALEKHADKIVFQFSLGAEPMPYETASILHQRTIHQIAEMIGRHPRLRFQVFLASRHANQAFCTMARELPNLSLAGYWWHNFFPDSMRQVIAERLDMLPVNKQIGFFSDAYCVEWVYGKVAMAEKQLARVLAEKILQGQYTRDDAVGIARSILYESPQTLLGMVG